MAAARRACVCGMCEGDGKFEVIKPPVPLDLERLTSAAEEIRGLNFQECVAKFPKPECRSNELQTVMLDKEIAEREETRTADIMRRMKDAHGNTYTAFARDEPKRFARAPQPGTQLGYIAGGDMLFTPSGATLLLPPWKYPGVRRMY